MMLFAKRFVAWRTGLLLGCLFVGVRSTLMLCKSGGYASDLRGSFLGLLFQGRFRDSSCLS